MSTGLHFILNRTVTNKASLCQINTRHTFAHFHLCGPTGIVSVLLHAKMDCLKVECILIAGSRFHYNYYDSTQGAIWQSIEHLDRMVSPAYQ